MGQRQSTTSERRGPYKYDSMIECEEREDAHLFSPKSWPPKRLGTQVEEPSMAGRCDLCGCHLTVYPGHATGEIPGIRVNLKEVGTR